MCIGKILNIYTMLSCTHLLFDQNDLDYKQAPEALFISSDSDLIAIGKDNNYQILSPTQLAGCVQKNHIYICDKLKFPALKGVTRRMDYMSSKYIDRVRQKLINQHITCYLSKAYSFGNLALD